MLQFVNNTALVCEGGGMRATYTAGMAEVLLEHGVKFPYVTGVSAGTTIAINYVMRNAARMYEGLVDLSANKDFAGMKHFVRGDGFFNSFYIYEEAYFDEPEHEANWQRFKSSGVEIALSAFNQDTGELRYWHMADFANYRDLQRVSRASSSLPLVMPATYIDGVGYVDGGVREGFVLQPAIDAGIERFVILPTHKRGYRREPSKSLAVAKVAYRHHPKVAEALETRAANYNAQMDFIDQLEAEGKALVLYPEEMPVERTETDHDKLAASWQLGRAQAEAQIDTWLDWMQPMATSE